MDDLRLQALSPDSAKFESKLEFQIVRAFSLASFGDERLPCSALSLQFVSIQKKLTCKQTRKIAKTYRAEGVPNSRLARPGQRLFFEPEIKVRIEVIFASF